jgi:hypothetical protein
LVAVELQNSGWSIASFTFIQLFISHAYPFPENPVLFGLETTIHHISPLKFTRGQEKWSHSFLSSLFVLRSRLGFVNTPFIQGPLYKSTVFGLKVAQVKRHL